MKKSNLFQITGLIICGIAIVCWIFTIKNFNKTSQLETDEVERGEFLEAELEVDFPPVTDWYLIQMVSPVPCEDHISIFNVGFSDGETYDITCEQFRELFKEFLIK